jgi:hypothetical protein
VVLDALPRLARAAAREGRGHLAMMGAEHVDRERAVLAQRCKRATGVVEADQDQRRVERQRGHGVRSGADRSAAPAADRHARPHAGVLGHALSRSPTEAPLAERPDGHDVADAQLQPLGMQVIEARRRGAAVGEHEHHVDVLRTTHDALDHGLSGGGLRVLGDLDGGRPPAAPEQASPRHAGSEVMLGAMTILN